MPTPNTSDTPFIDARELAYILMSKKAIDLELENNRIRQDKDQIAQCYVNMTKAITQTSQERDQLKAEVKQWQKVAEWLYEYVMHQGRCWTKDYTNLKAKDCTCRLNEALAEFEKLREGK